MVLVMGAYIDAEREAREHEERFVAVLMAQYRSMMPTYVEAMLMLCPEHPVLSTRTAGHRELARDRKLFPR